MMNGFVHEKVDPRTCWFRLGNKIRKIINKALDKNVSDSKDSQDLSAAIEGLKKAIAAEDDNKQLISYDNLSSVHKYLQRIDSDYNLYFYQLMDECRVVSPQSRKVCITHHDLHLFLTLLHIIEQRTRNQIIGTELQAIYERL